MSESIGLPNHRLIQMVTILVRQLTHLAIGLSYQLIRNCFSTLSYSIIGLHGIVHFLENSQDIISSPASCICATIEDVEVADFVQVGDIVMTEDDTLILKGKDKKDDIEGCSYQIRNQIQETSSENKKKNRNSRMSEWLTWVIMWIAFKVGGASKVGVTRSKVA